MPLTDAPVRQPGHAVRIPQQPVLLQRRDQDDEPHRVQDGSQRPEVVGREAQVDVDGLAEPGRLRRGRLRHVLQQHGRLPVVRHLLPALAERRAQLQQLLPEPAVHDVRHVLDLLHRHDEGRPCQPRRDPRAVPGGHSW